MLKTRMTEILGIKYPIQCGTMMRITTAELVAPVANAGGFCCLPAAAFPTSKELKDEIKKTQDLTNQPFGVNVSLFPALTPRSPEDVLEDIIESGVNIIETAGNNPEPYRQIITDANVTHVHKCARVQDAIKADKLGVDIISIVGTECGGHPSMEGVTSIVLIPKAAAAIKAPLIAGGGFCNGRSLIAALALGASGINMGTRFLATEECPVHENVKKRISAAGEADTMMIMKSLRNPSRVLRTPWTEKIVELESQGATLEDLIPYISGEVSKKGWNEGKLEEGIYAMGQAIGLIDDIPTVAELMESLIREADNTWQAVNKQAAS
jgi:NADH:quinone reductase (non-electrogenic)